MLAFPRRKGSASIAVNEWTSYFNVRMNQFEVLGGQQVIVKVKPVSHIATDAFRQLDPDERNCLFPYERAVYIRGRRFYRKRQAIHRQMKCMSFS